MSNNNNNHELHVILGRGPVGLAIMDELLAKGKQVRVVNRSGAPHPDIPEAVEIVAGDVSDPAAAIKLCAGASTVYNCTNPPYHKWPELFPPLQAAAIEGAAAAGAKLVVMDNTYMYGHTHGSPISEGTPQTTTTRKGKVRAQMAKDLFDAHQSGKVRAVAGRASDFFGPRVLVSSMGERVFYPLLKGKAAQIMGEADRLHTYTYVPDVAKGMVRLGEQDDAFGQAWHLPSSETVTTRQFIEMVAEEVGSPAKIQSMPKLMVKVLGLFMPVVREVEEMLYEFEEDFVLDHSQYAQTFGNHATPLREAVRATVQWFREHPQ